MHFKLFSHRQITYRFFDFVLYFLEFVRCAGVEIENVYPIKGFYEDTLNADTIPNNKLGSTAVIHIDCDLYTSTQKVLRFVESLLVPGTIIIFDNSSSILSLFRVGTL